MLVVRSARLLPAPAGMVPASARPSAGATSAPRTCGDGLVREDLAVTDRFCSPHPVGMAPTRSVRRARKGTAFRTSGDGPLFQADLARRNGCSLYPRGWSLSRCPPKPRALLFFHASRQRAAVEHSATSGLAEPTIQRPARGASLRPRSARGGRDRPRPCVQPWRGAGAPGRSISAQGNHRLRHPPFAQGESRRVQPGE